MLEAISKACAFPHGKEELLHRAVSVLKITPALIYAWYTKVIFRSNPAYWNLSQNKWCIERRREERVKTSQFVLERFGGQGVGCVINKSSTIPSHPVCGIASRGGSTDILILGPADECIYIYIINKKCNCTIFLSILCFSGSADLDFLLEYTVLLGWGWGAINNSLDVLEPNPEKPEQRELELCCQLL